MTKKENSESIWLADNGCIIIRKSDEKIMGTKIYLGSTDSIENYTERPYTEEEYNKLYNRNVKREIKEHKHGDR